MSKLEFPVGFFWGAATASHQVEGHTHNDWSEWEQTNAERLARESETAFRWNPHWQKFRTEATDPKNYLSGLACDHYRRFHEDFYMAKSLHHNAHRFSIEWSRIEPEEGVFDEKEIEHYRQVIHALRERNIEPFITLWHWTLPLWLANQGGVASKDFPKYFERYSAKISETLGKNITFWITLNEPEVMTAHAYLKGAWPPQRKNPFVYLYALHRLIAAHRLAYLASIPMPRLVLPNTRLFSKWLVRLSSTTFLRHWPTGVGTLIF
jgi:beta-glucosidase